MASKLIESGQYAIIGSLDTFSAFHVARKLAGVLPTLELALSKSNAAKDRTALLLMMFAQLTDEDAMLIVRKCMSIVRRPQPMGVMPVIDQASGVLMFADIGVSELIELSVAVIEASLGDFFASALDGLQSGAQAA